MLSRALEGTLVLDCSQGVAAPHAASLLGELGARVLKIEPPSGDWVRRIGVRTEDASVIFSTFNRGKRGVVLDLKAKQSRDALLRLAARADVFVESNRPGVMARLGLDYAAVQAVNPRIVYLSLTGFGQSGPSSQRGATDVVIQAYAGFSYGAGDMASPIRVRVAVMDVVSGVYASHAVLAALLQRARTGSGQHLDVNLTHCAAAMQGYKYAEHAQTGGRLQGEAFAGIGIYPTQEGYLALSAIREDEVVALLGLFGRADALSDPRFSTPEARFANQAALREIMAAALASRSAREWAKEITAIDLMCQEVHTYADFRQDAHTLSARLFQDLRVGDTGKLPAVRMPGLPAEGFSDTRPPRLGEHTREALLHEGFSGAEIDALTATGKK